MRAGARPFVRTSMLMATISDDVSEYTRAAFDAVDKDSNSLIDRSEMESALTDLGMSMPGEKTDALFDKHDADANNMIDFQEFEELLFSASFDPQLFTELEFKAAFDAVDADSNGVIDRAELRASLCRLNETLERKESVTELFDAYDEE